MKAAHSVDSKPGISQGKTRILASEPVALPPELAELTEILPVTADEWWERALRRLRLSESARRIHDLRRAWVLFRHAPRYAAVVTLGDMEGLFFAALERFRGQNRPVHVMFDCLWYGGGRLRRAWMRFCLRTVDRCIVWASVECERYSRAYGVPREKFLYVPHHHTLHHFNVKVGDQGFVFTGGNVDRDYGLFLDAVREFDVACVLATNRSHLLDGLKVPPNVQVQSLSAAEFRQRMAEAGIVVMPMRATLLHAGAQQSVLNAMLMGKPIILTDPEGGADYIENGRTGVLVPYGDPQALREKILFLLSHPAEARALGDNARRAAAPLTTEHCNALIWTHTLQLVSERRRTLGPHSQAGPQRGKSDGALSGGEA